jgi:hypothetical protein
LEKSPESVRNAERAKSRGVVTSGEKLTLFGKTPKGKEPQERKPWETRAAARAERL